LFCKAKQAREGSARFSNILQKNHVLLFVSDTTLVYRSFQLRETVMAKQRYICEKEWVHGDGPDFVRVTVCQVEVGGKSVTDITHQDSEALADEWLVEE
jgi:hypothetical protein